MWPYTDDEAGWLTPTPLERAAEPPARKPVNDNDPKRRLPPLR